MTEGNRREWAKRPIIVDASVLFSALLRDRTTRLLLLHGGFGLHTPPNIWDELERNRQYLVQKSGATERAFDALLQSLRGRVSAIPLPLIERHMDRALKALGEEDRLDAPYVASAMALDRTLWTHDKRVKLRAPILVVTTSEVVAAWESP
jgi:predicted nucleic acid-binding protein